MKRVWLEQGAEPNVGLRRTDLRAQHSGGRRHWLSTRASLPAGSVAGRNVDSREQFIPLLVEALQAWKPGHALDRPTTVGAVVDQRQLDNGCATSIGREQGAD